MERPSCCLYSSVGTMIGKGSEAIRWQQRQQSTKRWSGMEAWRHHGQRQWAMATAMQQSTKGWSGVEAWSAMVNGNGKGPWSEIQRNKDAWLPQVSKVDFMSLSKC
jgi:hypothetical protein